MSSAKSSASAVDDTDLDLLDDEVESRLYECCVLYAYPLQQKDESQLLKEVAAIFEEAGAKLVDKDPWGRRGLAFPIKGTKEATVVVYYYEIDPLKVKEVDQALKIQKNVLRHLFVKPPKGYVIVKYGALYEQWLKERESIDQKRAREREERLRDQVAEKAKRRARISTEVKKEAPKKAPGAPVSEEAMTQQIDKLISDDSFGL